MTIEALITATNAKLDLVIALLQQGLSLPVEAKDPVPATPVPASAEVQKRGRGRPARTETAAAPVATSVPTSVPVVAAIPVVVAKPAPVEADPFESPVSTAAEVSETREDVKAALERFRVRVLNAKLASGADATASTSEAIVRVRTWMKNNLGADKFSDIKEADFARAVQLADQAV